MYWSNLVSVANLLSGSAHSEFLIRSVRKVGQNMGKTGSARGRSSFSSKTLLYPDPAPQCWTGKCNMKRLRRRDINGVDPLSQILE